MSPLAWFASTWHRKGCNLWWTLTTRWWSKQIPVSWSRCRRLIVWIRSNLSAANHQQFPVSQDVESSPVPWRSGRTPHTLRCKRSCTCSYDESVKSSVASVRQFCRPNTLASSNVTLPSYPGLIFLSIFSLFSRRSDRWCSDILRLC